MDGVQYIPHRFYNLVKGFTCVVFRIPAVPERTGRAADVHAAVGMDKIGKGKLGDASVEILFPLSGIPVEGIIPYPDLRDHKIIVPRSISIPLDPFPRCIGVTGKNDGTQSCIFVLFCPFFRCLMRK